MWRRARQEIFALTDAVVLRDTAEYPDARIRAELRFGRDATDRLVMVAANFQQMNRMMDAIGGRVPTSVEPLAAEMGLTIPTISLDNRLIVSSLPGACANLAVWISNTSPTGSPSPTS